MADLPMNTTYKAGGASAPPSAADFLKFAQAKPVSAPQSPDVETSPEASNPAQMTLPNVMGAYKPTSPEVSGHLSSVGASGFLPQTPIGAPAEKKISPIPAGYSPFVVPGARTNPASGVVPENPAIHQFPSGGQMNVDLANPGKLNKSVREDGSNQSMLGTLSNKMFQVDHIIPLFLGGADTIGNKQILPTPVHDAKTKIQAVAQTLLDNGVIDLNQARVMALTWQNRSANGIPSPNHSGTVLNGVGPGEIPLETAKALAKEWDDFDAGKAKPTLKEILHGIPAAANEIGKDVLPEWARQLMVGFASGVTAGGIPLESAPGATILDKASGLVGEAAGMFVGIGKFAKLTEMAGRAIGMIKPGIKMAAGATEGGASILDSLVPAAVKNQGKTAAEKASISLAERMKTAIKPSTIMRDIRGKLASDIVGRTFKNAVAFGAYGQMGQTIQDLTQDREDALQQHMSRLWEDLAFGAVVGAIPGTWKGAGSVGGAVTTLALMSGDNLQSALSQGVAMGALHRLGGLGQDMKKTQADIENMSTEAAGKGALSVLHTVLGDKPGLSRIDPKAPMPKYDPAKLDTYLDEGLTKLNDMRDNGQISPSIWMRLQISLRASVSTLKTLTLPFERQDKTFWEGLSSMAKYSKNRNNVSDLTVPNALTPYARKFSDLFPERIKETPEQTIERNRWAMKDSPRGEGNPQNKGAVGEIPFTGENASVENAADHKLFQEKIRSGEASPYGIIMNTNDPLFGIYARDTNRAITPKMTSEGVSPIEPEDHLRVFAIVTDKTTGEQSIIRTGLSVPTRERIGTLVKGEDGKMTVDGKPFSFNSHPDISGPEPKYPANDPNYNNKTISTMMRHRGLSAIPVRFKSFLNKEIQTNPRADIPYTIGVVGDEELGMAKQLQDALGHPAGLNTVEENLSMAKKLAGTGMEKPFAERSAQQMYEDGANAVDVVAAEKLSPTNQPRQGALTEILNKTNEVLVDAKTPAQVQAGFREKLGVELTADEAALVVQKKASITGGEVVDLMDKAVIEGRTTPMTAGNFVTEVKPIKTSKEFKASTAGTTFNYLPVVRQEDLLATHASKLTRAAASEGESMAPTASLTGSRGPVEASGTTPEALKKVEELEGIWLDKGNSIEPVATDTYTSKVVSFINNSGLDEEGKKTLAKKALDILGSEDELALRGMQRTRSDVAWTEGTRSSQASNTLYPLKNELEVISVGFPEKAEEAKDIIKVIDTAIKEYGSGDAPIDPEESKMFLGLMKQLKDATKSLKDETVGAGPKKQVANELEEAAIAKADVAPWFAQLKIDRASSPDTYVRGYAETFDELAKKAWGENYQSNTELMRILTDKTEIGKKVWTGTRFEKGKMKPGLLASQPITARSQLGQPHDVLAAAGSGDRNAMSVAMKRRREEKGDNAAVNISDEAGDVIGIGGHVTSSKQDPSMNVQDLTPYEAERRKGLLDEEVQGPDPIKSPIRGSEDAMSDIFGYVSAYNEGIKKGILKGPRAGSVNKDIATNVKKKIAEEYKVRSEFTDNIARVQEKIDLIKKQDEDLSKVGGRRATEYAKKVTEADKKVIADLQEIIDNYKRNAGIEVPVAAPTPAAPVAPVVPEIPAAPVDPRKEDAKNSVMSAIKGLSEKFKGDGQTELPLGQGGPGVPQQIDASPIKRFGGLAAGIGAAFPQIGEQPKPSEIKITPVSSSSTLQTPSIQPPTTTTINPVDTSKATKTLGLVKEALGKIPNPLKKKEKITMSPTKFTSTIKSMPEPRVGDSSTIGLTSGQGLNPAAKGASYYMNRTSPVVAGVNTESYATDPLHSTGINKLMAEIPTMSSPVEFQSFIDQRVGKKSSPITGDMIAKAVQWNQLTPEETKLMFALMLQDSDLGRKGLAVKTRNPGNVGNTDSGAMRVYHNWEDGVISVSNMIAQNRLSKDAQYKVTDPSKYVVIGPRK